MCGIAGIVSVRTEDITVGRLKRMTDSIAHRGPDGEGHWISENGHVGLGHRRLSIIDLSHEADQPMHYLDRYSIIFNGEIYNYIELKEELQKQGFSFKTSSDTEVLLALYHRDKKDCLRLLDGMFSFVIYDKERNEIFAARDRFGEKPFYYSYSKGKYFLFGSEMKCLWAAGIDKAVNKRMLFNYLSAGYLNNPLDITETFYEGCVSLPHSHCLLLDVNKCELSIERYYDIDVTKIDHTISSSDAIEKFREIFYTSVNRRLRSDVPVGSSLSGGLDSSAVVTVIDEIKKGSGGRQDTFSAVFPGFIKDERQYMDHVIAKTNVNPHFITPDDAGLVASVDKLFHHQEEPFGSASIYVQYCVMELAKKNNVTVLLDGQGADEMLAGYHHFYPHFFTEIKKKDSKLFRDEFAAYTDLHSNSNINPLMERGPKQMAKQFVGTYAPGIRRSFQRMRAFQNPLLDIDFRRTYNKETYFTEAQPQGLNNVLYRQTFHQGLQELLRYADRNSMAHSREVRLPFLSHELAEFLFSLPSTMKINGGWTKWIMRKAFEKELPPEISWRKDKIGYEPPQKNWMDAPAIKEEIGDIKQKLVKEHILAPVVLQNAGGPADKKLQEASWKIFMAGQLFK